MTSSPGLHGQEQCRTAFRVAGVLTVGLGLSRAHPADTDARLCVLWPRLRPS